ncbi:hypothetical protein L218DRAFT_989589 [Marasmius fiardii PR-910]|nr:hypothetical protein L218DRAFT_989589 [Marasmius fiardii PR-910]
MPPKRCLTPLLDSPSAKRRRTSISDDEELTIRKFYSLPSTPFSYQHDFLESNTSTPYPPFPSDSPSNPFGRRRSLAPLLPPSTPFGRHVVLRLRFFRAGEVIDRRGVYRVVQVPLSYTFRHLKTLIAFLFGGQSGMDDVEDEDIGHLFEVRRNVEMWARSYRHGAIKRGKTSIRLSSVCDPYRYKEEWDFNDASWDIGEDKGQEEEEETDELQEDDEPRWEAEEDYTLEHVWNSEEDQLEDHESTPRLKPVAIVYYYTPASNHEHKAQVHITLEDAPSPPRKGRGNTPTVFKARGHVYLSPVPEDDCDEWEEEDWEAMLSPDNWNNPPKAFSGYLRRISSLPPPILYKHSALSTTSITSTPGLANDFSSSPPKSSPFPSTPFSPIGRAFSLGLLGSSSISPAPKRLIGVFPKHTPALPHAQRKRSAYIAKRIERSKQRTRSRPRKEDEIEGSQERVKLQDRNSDGEEALAGNELLSGENGDDSDRTGGEEETKEDDRKTIRVRGVNGEYMTLEEAMLLVVDEQEV